MYTMPTQIVSQAPPASEQQNGSTAQTAVQHASSSQSGVLCGKQHDPAHASPHSETQLHSGFWRALLAQLSSQAVSQQKGSP